jgi:glycosyltransferase involved in cell wall biosynthesis
VKKTIDFVIVIPVGPSGDTRYNIEYIQDTIDSVIFYVGSSFEIIILDDSGTDTGSQLLGRYPFLKIIRNQKNYGLKGELYYSLSQVYEFAIKNYDFRVLLRMDTDTLMIGPSPEKDAISYFGQNPGIGQLGSYKVDCNGDKRDNTFPREELRRETGLKNAISNWKQCFFLRNILSKAIKNGYEPGEHCIGAAYFISRDCMHRLFEQGLLLREELRSSKLAEDHIFSLLIRSCGFDIGDFATGELPLGIRWHGLPCSPDELVLRKKKLIHSTRFWEGMNEEMIREFFRRKREKADR